MRSTPSPLSLLLTAVLLTLSLCEIALNACENDTPSSRTASREKARQLFYHGYEMYKNNAFPHDELRPLSCDGVDSFGGIHVTLIDALDTLAVLGDWEEFTWAAREVAAIPDFHLAVNVSVFETNIRVLGALVSAHGLLTDAAPAAGWVPEEYYPEYDGGLLRLAVDLGDRLLPAFETETGIPYGTVGLDVGVQPGETVIASTAAAGGLLVEMGSLSVMTGDGRYYEAAFRALEGLHSRAAWTGLVGNHVDTMSGEWTAHESGIGALIDSYYEYMVKGYILFGDMRLLNMFYEAYNAVQRYLRRGPWYLPADMFTGQTSSLGHCSLGAFWPGMQVLVGEIDDAIETTRAHFSVWRRYGCLPEAWHVYSQAPVDGAVNYPLRPELLESVFYLHWATNDSSWIGVARSMMHSLENLTRVECGFARIRNVVTHEQENLQDSFLLSETLKYMYLMFDDGHWLRSGQWVLSTEAHPMFISGKATPGVPSPQPPLARPSKKSRTPPRQKCPRRSSISRRSACGIGMPGTDYPSFDLASIRQSSIPTDVQDIIRDRIAKRVPPLVVGEVVFGATGGFRVTRIAESGEVFLVGLSDADTVAAKERQMQAALETVLEALRMDELRDEDGEGLCPSISLPRLLVGGGMGKEKEKEKARQCLLEDAEMGLYNTPPLLGRTAVN